MSNDAKPIKTEPASLVPARYVDPQDPTAEGMALFEESAKHAKRKLTLALSVVQPGQFVVMESKGQGGAVKESIYATGGAGDRILRMVFGMTWGEKSVHVEYDPESHEPLSCTVEAPLLKPGGDEYETFTGRRRMGGFVHNEHDLIKGAIENMKHQAVTDILGLRFLTPGDLAELGVDVKALPRRAEFQDRGKDESGAAVVPWGKKKGESVTTLEDRDLDYYAGKARETLADASKSKFHAHEKAWCAAIEAEQARRKAPIPPTQTEEMDTLRGDIAKVAASLGVEETTVKAGLAKLDSIAKAKKWLADLQARAKAPAPECSGDHDAPACSSPACVWREQPRDDEAKR